MEQPYWSRHEDAMRTKREYMKIITIRIEEDQYNRLQNIAKEYKIKGVSSLIRRSIALFLNTEERRKPYEYDEHEQKHR